MIKNERSIYWTLLLYKDSESYDTEQIIKEIKSKYNSIYILHDKDTYNEDIYNEDNSIKHKKGEIKKKHYHIVLKFKNYKWLNTLSEELNIEMNYFQKINNLENILCYLIHYKEDNKYHYGLEEVKGSRDLISKLRKIIENIDTTEEERITKIINFIRLEKHIISENKMIDYILNNGLWGEYRRSYTIINNIRQEHNNFILDNLKN